MSCAQRNTSSVPFASLNPGYIFCASCRLCACLQSEGTEPIPRLFPPGWAVPRSLPWPSEITPAPLAPPDVNPITIPRNPYPQRPKCRREWQIATEDCLKLWTDGQLGRDYIRGAGDTVAQCIMGRVSQDCGGNRL